MKERSKESNKEEKQQEAQHGLVDSRENFQEENREDLRIDVDAFLKFFNDTLQREKSSIPTAEFVSPGYGRRIQALANAYNSKTVLVIAVQKMARSDFLNGRVKGRAWNKPFIASLIWLLESDENFNKVLNGYYDNPPPVALTEDEKRQQAEELRQREAEERRRKNLEIDRQIREEQRRAREEAHANRATPEQLQEIFEKNKPDWLKKS